MRFICSRLGSLPRFDTASQRNERPVCRPASRLFSRFLTCSETANRAGVCSTSLCILATYLAAALLVACGGERITPSRREAQCRRVCEQEKQCETANESSKRFDCYSACSDIDAAVVDSRCFARFDYLYACIEQRGVCDPGRSLCDSRQTAFDDCIAENCSDNPDIDDCAL